MSLFDWIKQKLGIPNAVYLSDEDSSSISMSDSEDEDINQKELDANTNTDQHKVEAVSDMAAEKSNNILTNLTTDAAVRIASLPTAECVINLDTVADFEDLLDIDEKISLVYLLYDHTYLALQELTLLLNGSNKKLLYEWAVKEQAKSDWQKKIVEALCIVKNYRVLKKMGFKKTDVILHYLPHQASTALHISKSRKVLYTICDKLDMTRTLHLIGSVRKYFRDRNKDFVEYDPKYLELFLLDWETNGFIQAANLNNLRNILKLMEEEALCNLIDELCPRIDSLPNAKDAIKSDNNIRGSDKPSVSYEYNETTQNDSQKYEIDPSNPGVVLIINQETFYTEIRDEYKHLLPHKTGEKLESRSGTRVDKEKLEQIFKRFGFKVIVEENLTHLEMIEKIKEVVASVKDESSFFLCILSHGDKGVVYGCNSCKVKITSIQQYVSKSNLLGKPKVLILQSCQGRRCQILNDDSSDDDDYIDNNDDDLSLTVDGPSSSRPALTRTADLLLFWATVPGYAAIRDKKKGSWFIQTLCSKMEELQNRIHFANICTRTLNEVTSKIWDSEEEKKAMTPMVMSTLRFDFFLPAMRKD